MKILIAGGAQPLGWHLAHAFSAAGHDVVAAAHDAGFSAAATQSSWTLLALPGSDEHPAWPALLEGVDAVVSLDQPAGPGEADAVQALFSACTRAGVRRLVHVSGTPAYAGRETAARAGRLREVLARLPVTTCWVGTGPVYGPAGPLDEDYAALATMPCSPTTAGLRELRPVHVDQVVTAVLALVAAPSAPPPAVEVMGPQAVRLADFLGGLRRALDMPGRPRLVGIAPAAAPWLRQAGIPVAAAAPPAARGAAATPVRKAGEGAPAPLVEPPYVRGAAASARLRWLLPVLRAAIGIMWIVTGIVSLGLYPVQESYALLARSGVPATLQPLALYGAAVLDIVLGVLTFVARGRRAVWLAQIALILAYTLIISVRLPEFWLHPYGPILKNLPILAALWLLYATERRRWNT